MSVNLSHRIQALTDNYKSIATLIQELHKFPNGTTPPTDDLDEQRLELANSCHQSLKDAEESLELLRQEVEDSEPQKGRRSRLVSSKDEERERQAASIARLSEDIRAARGTFRRAQLQSKKNLDSRKQKEREQLFANRRNGAINGSAPQSKRGQEKLTQDELAQNAADDVTRALRRTHAMMSTNLQQSQFAQQTLDESQEQLRTLSEQYTGTTDMLQKSRGLVKTLLTSQKSDTWYLRTSFYILLATISWLIFRRLLYGPLWWFAWLPIKYSWLTLTFIFGGEKLDDSAGQTLSTGLTVPTNSPGSKFAYQSIPAKGAGWGGSANPPDIPDSPGMVQKVSKMIEDAENENENQYAQEEDESQPRNPKKRMMEVERENIKDEL